MEIEGYAREAELPAYRVVPCIITSTAMGMGDARAPDIAPGAHRFAYARLTSPAALLEATANSESGSVEVVLTPDEAAELARAMAPGLRGTYQPRRSLTAAELRHVVAAIRARVNAWLIRPPTT